MVHELTRMQDKATWKKNLERLRKTHHSGKHVIRETRPYDDSYSAN